MIWLVFTILLAVGAFACIGTMLIAQTSEKKAGAGVALLVIVVVEVALTIGLSLYTVGQRQVGIQYNFAGSIVGKKSTGWGLKAPWTRLQTANVGVLRENFALDQTNSAVSSDQQAIFADLALNYEVLPRDILHLYKTVGPNWKAILLDSRVLQDFKQVTSTFTAEQITTNRQKLRDATKVLLIKELGQYGIGVVDFFVTNLEYTQSYQDSINQKNIQVQKALQAQAKVAQSRAEAEQTVATAQGYRLATIARAEGDAKANRLLSASINDKLIQLRVAQALGKANTIYVPKDWTAFGALTGSGK